MTRDKLPTGHLSLFAWQEEMRRRDLERRRRLRHRIAFVLPLIGAVALSAAIPMKPRLVWNASASAPIGLYVVIPNGVPRRGDFIIARVPVAVRSLAARRRYIPVNVPLVKHVGAIAGDTVCASAAVVTIDTMPAAIRREHDGAGRAMPWWNGCKRLRPDEIFLLSRDAPASFDGRYFGVSPRADIIGTARPLWVR